ncbi:hypothetical protein GCM10027259_45190 [Micromonospora palomenae]
MGRGTDEERDDGGQREGGGGEQDAGVLREHRVIMAVGAVSWWPPNGPFRLAAGPSGICRPHPRFGPATGRAVCDVPQVVARRG